MTKRQRVLLSLPLSVALLVGGTLGAGTAAATGTCKGRATEYPLPVETHDPSLTAYDVNGDGVICVAVKGRRTVYSDNRI